MVQIVLPNVKARNPESAKKKVLNWLKKSFKDEYPNLDVILDHNDERWII